MRKAVLLVLVVCGLCSASPRTQAPPPSAAELAAAERISAQEMRAHTRFLASDLLEGRGPGTRGDKLAQAYIAAQFEGMGLLPAGAGGGYLQRFELVGVTGHPESMEVKGPGGELALRYWDELIAVSGSQKPQAKLRDAELVFVGYGIEAPEYDWDDFKGLDVRGKVLLMMNSDPEDDPALFGGRARLWYGRWDYKFEVAAKKGAAGAIIIHTTASAGYPWKVVQTSWSGAQFELPQEAGPRLEVKAWTTEEATRKLLALAGHDLVELTTRAQRREFEPVPLGLRVSTSFDSRVETVETANVLAILPGSDPRLKDELVVYTAHHDHLGKKEGGAPGEDVIFNGAVDNASGVAAMLAVARAMTTLHPAPKRSILFAAVAAEEQGLLGSEYLAAHPPRAAGFLAADVNIDGVNFRGRTRDLTMIGLGKSSLDDLVVPLARAQHREVKPDQMPDRGFFYRSDQFNFARIGVPAVYLGSGLDFIGRPPGWGKQMRERWEAERYHQVSDEFDPEWDFSGAVEDARLYLLIGARVANALAMPQWRKGDEFELARKRALESRTAGAAGR